MEISESCGVRRVTATDNPYFSKPASNPPHAQKFNADNFCLGLPGDFRFSDVPKPENSLHTYRDLNQREHATMLEQLMDGAHRFL